MPVPNGRPRSRAGAASSPSAAAVITAEAEPDMGRLKGDADERALAEVQALTQGLTPVNSVEFQGRRYRIAAKVGLMPLMKFAAAADSQLDTSDMAALSAIYHMLQDCIQGEVPPCGDCPDCKNIAAGDLTAVCPFADKGDWHKFEAHAIASKAEAEELLPVVQQTVEILTSRPTLPRSGSSSP